MSNSNKSKKDKEILAEYESQVKDVRAQLVEQQRCLEQQTEMRVQLLQDLQDFFRKKSEIETEYSRNLEKLAERFMAKTRSTKDHQQYKKDQNLLSPVNCWYLLLNQVRRESKDHATLSDLYLNNVISRLTHISEDSARLLKRVSPSHFTKLLPRYTSSSPFTELLPLLPTNTVLLDIETVRWRDMFYKLKIGQTELLNK
ncbi:SLIT-ROBO Rho GTPase-activating protein 1-like [Clinocottus analis]|uniref:SLIT-ROBO Rho GTPase-activating protein 1-like n=1 Tax=Clinocottus analis TaxID=304258 RepID=UPI0035C195DE